MANNSTRPHEISELRSQMNWMDEEQRKLVRRLAELEQKVKTQEQALAGRDQRVRELESSLSEANAQLNRLSQFEGRLQVFKDEMVQLIEQSSGKQKEVTDELERRRRVELEIQSRELASIRKELLAIGRLQNDMELRQAEEARLAHLIGTVQSQTIQLSPRLDQVAQETSFAQEAARQNARRLEELDNAILAAGKRFEAMQLQLEQANDQAVRLAGDVRSLTEAQAELQKAMRNWTEQVQLGEYERNNRLSGWETYLGEVKEQMNAYAQQWGSFHQQYQEAGTALQSLVAWKEQLETQLREGSERNRVEADRLLAQWQEFQNEQEKTRLTAQVESEQRWSGAERRERQLAEKLLALEELLEQTRQEAETMWRIQSAQADALKQLPRIWLEEVEKAIAQNPYRRRQPAPVTVREE